MTRPQLSMPGRPSLSRRPARPDEGAARRSRSLAIWSAAVVAVAGLAGWSAGGLPAPGGPTDVPPAQPVDLGAAALTAPGSWEPAAVGDAGLPDLGARASAFAPLPGLTGYAVVVLLPFDDPTLAPATLRALAGPGRPRGRSMAGLPAWRYRQQAVMPGRIAQLTVAPTTAGSLSVVCVADDAAWPGVQGCADDLTGADLRGAAPLLPSPTLAFRHELAPVMARLDRRRGELRSRLRAAPSRRAQARFARRLDTVHRRALVALAPRAPDAGAARRAVRELRRTARSYRRLAAAARTGWPRRYRHARRAIRRSDRALARAVARIR